MPTTLSRSPSMAGKARVRRCQHLGHPFLDRLGQVDHVHLRARHHDVARGQVGHLEHAFDHRQGVGIDQVAFVRIVQDVEQLGAVFGLGGDECGQSLKQRPVGFDVGTDVIRMLWHSWREPLLRRL
jgi:hypothetical protein